MKRNRLSELAAVINNVVMELNDISGAGDYIQSVAASNRSDEEETLKLLTSNLDIALNMLNDVYDNGEEPEYTQDTIRITVNGYNHDFILGGPQATALQLFTEWIAYENGYSIDRDILHHITHNMEIDK